MSTAFKLNSAQLRSAVCEAHFQVDLWGRATGKSLGLAIKIIKLMRLMPRASGALVGRTYQEILTRTLPSTINGLRLLGFHNGIHFLIGKPPPKNMRWPLPYEPPLKFNYYVLFYNGFGFHLISQDRKGSGLGLNIDFVLGDEALYLDQTKLKDEVYKANRGNLRAFGHIALHHCVHLISSMPDTKEGEWFLEKEGYYQEMGFDFDKIRSDVANTQIEFLDESNPDKRRKIAKELTAMESQIKYRISKNGIFFNRASTFANVENVGLNYIINERRESEEMPFRRDLLNQKQDRIEGGFYPALTDKNFYTNFDNDYLTGLDYNFNILEEGKSLADADVDQFKKLIVCVDFGHHINCVSVAQTHQHTNHYEELRIVNGIFVKPPRLLDDLADKFCKYYDKHSKKVIEQWYDASGNQKGPNDKATYNEQFTKKLKDAGWAVETKGFSSNPTGPFRYLMVNNCLAENRRSLPMVRINRINAKYVKLSMEQSPVKERDAGVFKDKKAEKNWKFYPQEEAPHFSDTIDYLICGKYGHLHGDNKPQFIDHMMF